VISRTNPGTTQKHLPRKSFFPGRGPCRLFLCGVLLCGALLVLESCGLKKSDAYTQGEMETRIRGILAVPTYEHVYRDVVYASQESRFLGIKTRENQTLFSVEIVVQAGLDLSRGFDLDFPETGTAVVSLPGSEILEIDADERTIRQYFSKERGGDIDRLAYYDEIDAKKQFLREDAVSRGILTRADENARSLIRNLLEFAGFEDVRFEMLPKGTIGTQGKTVPGDGEADEAGGGPAGDGNGNTAPSDSSGGGTDG
jgi:hypothetical protein